MAEEVVNRDIKEFGSSLWSKRNKHSDSVLIANGERISVHSIILSSASEYFDNIFDEFNEWTFYDVDMEIFRSLIEYCYTGSIRITETNAEQIFNMAIVLKIPTIIDRSSEILKKILKINNVLSMWKMANTGKSQSSNKIILPFIKKNFEAISRCPEFLALEYEDLNKLLKSIDNFESEKIVYDAIKKWTNNDISKTSSMVNLLDYVKLECLPTDFLLSESLSMCNNNECYKKFNEAMLKNKTARNCEKTSDLSTLVAMSDGSDGPCKNFEVYDININQWVQINYVESNKSSFGAVLLDDKIIITGGWTNGQTMNTAEYYDLKTGNTEILPPMKYMRWYPVAVKLDKYVYVLGGSSNSSKVERWDPISKKWDDMAPMKFSRHEFGAAVLENEIYAVGGRVLNQTEAYNPITNQWRNCANLQEKRFDLGVAVVGNYLYAIGGKNEHSTLLKTVERYDREIDKWTYVGSLIDTKSSLAAGNLNGKIVMTGGGRSSEIYDVKTNNWERFADMKNNRHHHVLVQIPWTKALLLLARKA